MSKRYIVRRYSPTVLTLEENALSKEAASEIHNRRVAYKKEVSILRKSYASEVALQRATDQAELAAKLREETRRTLERKRIKNIKAAQSSIRELERRRRRELEFQEELRAAQANRDARNERFRKARQLLVDELEAEAPLWLTTAEEVDAAFTKAAEQELWALPNSVLGAPLPTDDAVYWNFESHTYHMDRSYQTRQEALTEEMFERAYDEANIDMSYWTPERLQARAAIDEKAKLRAMVRLEGRRSLLMKQKELLQDLYPQGLTAENTVPRRMPVPNVKLLADEKAMEKEGMEVLLKDPTKFFVFDAPKGSSVERSDAQSNSSEYDGPVLGVPRGLKDVIKLEKTLDKAYPKVVGKLPKPDTRTAREKKREEKERAMMSAAKKDDTVDFDSEDIDDINVEEIDLDSLVYEDEDGWEAGLDPEKDKKLLALPLSERYTEDEVDAVVERLEKKLRFLEEELDYELNTTQQQLQARIEMGQMPEPGAFAEEEGDSKYSLEVGENVYDMESLGLDSQEVDKILSSLTEQQILALHVLDRESGGSLSMDDLRRKLAEVPGLTDDQINAIVTIEETLSSNEIVRRSEEALGLHVDSVSLEGNLAANQEAFAGLQAEFDALGDEVSDEEIAQLQAEFGGSVDASDDATEDIVGAGHQVTAEDPAGAATDGARKVETEEDETTNK